jgi:hypothetical protein
METNNAAFHRRVSLLVLLIEPFCFGPLHVLFLGVNAGSDVSHLL